MPLTDLNCKKMTLTRLRRGEKPRVCVHVSVCSQTAVVDKDSARGTGQPPL